MNPSRLHLYWFSGSGNTLQAAAAFADRLAALGWSVELRALEKSDPRAIDPSAVLGLAFPTHCFVVPEIVRSFVCSLPQVEQIPAMMLGTHGAFSGGVLGPLKRTLAAKGFRCTAAKIISMPDSFFPFSNESANQQKRERALHQTSRYAEEFTEGNTHWSRWAILSDVYAAFFYGFFASRKLARKYFTTIHVQQDRCTRCGVCVRFCPVNALRQEDDTPPCVNKNCTNCLRCVAICPVDAMRHMIGFQPYRSEKAAALERRFEKVLGNHAGG